MRDWEREVRSAALRAERELRELIGYVSDRLVPAARAESSRARRKGASLPRSLADRLDARAGQAGGRG